MVTGLEVERVNIEKKKIELFKEIIKELKTMSERLDDFVSAYESVHHRELNPRD